MPYPAPSKCPVCGGAMQVTGLQCPHCATALSGTFSPCRFCALPEKELHFIEVFLKCRGSIKDVERELGISYPTVRNMLDQTLRALGLAPTAGEQAASVSRSEILDLLEQGKIDATEAASRLKAIGREES